MALHLVFLSQVLGGVYVGSSWSEDKASEHTSYVML